MTEDERWVRTARPRRVARSYVPNSDPLECRLSPSSLAAMDAIDALRVRVERYRQAHPGQPVTWDLVVGAGLLPGVPVDSSGTPFTLDPASGSIAVSQQSKLFPLPGQLQGPQ